MIYGYQANTGTTGSYHPKYTPVATKALSLPVVWSNGQMHQSVFKLNQTVEVCEHPCSKRDPLINAIDQDIKLIQNI